MHRIHRALAAGAFVALVGCATGGGSTSGAGSPKVAAPACAPYRVDIDPAIELGRRIDTPMPDPPRNGPPTGYACVVVTITAEGRVADPEIRATNEYVFAASFVDILSRWRFEPSTRDGEAVSFRTLLSASYRRERRN